MLMTVIYFFVLGFRWNPFIYHSWYKFGTDFERKKRGDGFSTKNRQVHFGVSLRKFARKNTVA
jgi:hypothetical protein